MGDEEEQQAIFNEDHEKFLIFVSVLMDHRTTVS
jgi:hypothetical protein